MDDRMRNWRESILKRLEDICSLDGKVPRRVAEDVVAGSAWWESHPSGPVQAPNHASRITGTESTWRIEFGANSFLISDAVRRCCNYIRKWATAQNAQVTANSWVDLHKELSAIIRMSVSNYRGDDYFSYGEDTPGKMIFGAQAIYIDDFIRCLSTLLNKHELCAFRNEDRCRYNNKPAKIDYETIVSSILSMHEDGSVLGCPFCGVIIRLENLKYHVKCKCPNGQKVKYPKRHTPKKNL